MPFAVSKSQPKMFLLVDQHPSPFVSLEAEIVCFLFGLSLGRVSCRKTDVMAFRSVLSTRCSKGHCATPMKSSIYMSTSASGFGLSVVGG